jgi:hypothetical protein
MSHVSILTNIDRIIQSCHLPTELHGEDKQNISQDYPTDFISREFLDFRPTFIAQQAMCLGKD